jgi:putative pyruvate formate lyase activating enzyme
MSRETLGVNRRGTAITDFYTSCRLCPRACRVDRAAGERGFCGETAALRIASASLHSGEEPPLTGDKGSGTIFVTGCNVGCRFCQNIQISQKGMGREAGLEEFAEVCRELHRRGAANINIVTGSHAIPAIAAGLQTARDAGITLPVLWNSSAYETVEALTLLDGEYGGHTHRLVDVWLPDLKTLDGDAARRYLATPDYPDTAVKAIRFMMDKAPLEWEGLPFESALLRGVIIRHLVLPGAPASTEGVLRWFAENARGRALLSLMTQYTPVSADNNALIPDTYLSEEETAAVLEMLAEFGIDEGFVQEPVQDDAWLPDFDRMNPFASALSVPVWHWKCGMVDGLQKPQPSV